MKPNDERLKSLTEHNKQALAEVRQKLWVNPNDHQNLQFKPGVALSKIEWDWIVSLVVEHVLCVDGVIIPPLSTNGTIAFLCFNSRVVDDRILTLHTCHVPAELGGRAASQELFLDLMEKSIKRR